MSHKTSHWMRLWLREDCGLGDPEFRFDVWCPGGTVDAQWWVDHMVAHVLKPTTKGTFVLIGPGGLTQRMWNIDGSLIW